MRAGLEEMDGRPIYANMVMLGGLDDAMYAISFSCLHSFIQYCFVAPITSPISSLHIVASVFRVSKNRQSLSFVKWAKRIASKKSV